MAFYGIIDVYFRNAISLEDKHIMECLMEAVIPAAPSYLPHRHTCRTVIPAAPSYLPHRHTCRTVILVEKNRNFFGDS